MKPASSSPYPPIPTKAPPVFGSVGTKTTTTPKPASSPYPPIPTKAPPVFGAATTTTTPKPASFSPSPALATTAPKPFGASPAPSSAVTSVTGTQQEKEKMSQCSQQFVDLVDKLNKGLADLVVGGTGSYDDGRLRKEIERHVEEACRAFVDFREIFSSQSQYTGRAASLLRAKTEASRLIAESERLLEKVSSPTEQGLDDFSTQPLDRQSEQRRRELNSSAIHARRLLGILKARRGVVDTIDEPEGELILLRSIVGVYHSIKRLNEDATRIEKKVFDIYEEKTKQRSPPALRSPLILQSPRATLFRGALSTPASTLAKKKTGRRERDGRDVQKWNAVERSFQNLQVPSVKSFHLEATMVKKVDESPHAGLEKARSLAAVSSPAYNRRSQPLFSPPLPVKTRSGWDEPSNTEQLKMKQMSFSAPRDLKDTTLGSASRDALVDFGTTPEKVAESLRINKRGMPLRPPAPGGFSAESSKGTTTKASSPFPPMPTKAPTSVTETPLGFGKVSPEAKASSASSSTSVQKAGSVSAKSSGVTPGTTFAKEKAPVTAADDKKSAFGSMGALGSSSLFSTGFGSSTAPASGVPSEKDKSVGLASGTTSSVSSGPDYHKILTQFYQTHNPSKMADVDRHLEKYKVSSRARVDPLFLLALVDSYLKNTDTCFSRSPCRVVKRRCLRSSLRNTVLQILSTSQVNPRILHPHQQLPPGLLALLPPSRKRLSLLQATTLRLQRVRSHL